MNKVDKISLIVTDMDETLLGKDKNVSPFNMSTIEKLKDINVHFSICTGRIQPMTEAYVKMLDLRCPYITANGALIWDPVKRHTLWGQPIEKEDVMDMALFCEANDIDYGVLTMDTSYFYKKEKTKERFYVYNEIARSQGLKEMKLEIVDEKLDCLKEAVCYKFLIWNRELDKIDIAEDFLKTRENISVTHSQKGLIDIMYKGVDKGLGVRKLAELMGIPTREVCVFGDYYNDLPMFREAGYPVAMGNAVQEVKEAAAYVTKTNEEDGVAYAIKELLKI